MKSVLGAKANTATQMIIWLTLLVAGLILILWFVNSGVLMLATGYDSLDMDLVQIQLMVDQACVSNKYENSYNPITNKGSLMFERENICIEVIRSGFGSNSTIKSCTRPVCRLPFDMSFNLRSLKEVVVKKDENLEIYTT